MSIMAFDALAVGVPNPVIGVPNPVPPRRMPGNAAATGSRRAGDSERPVDMQIAGHTTPPAIMSLQTNDDIDRKPPALARGESDLDDAGAARDVRRVDGIAGGGGIGGGLRPPIKLMLPGKARITAP